MDQNTIVQMTGILRTGDWIHRDDLLTVPHWDRQTVEDSLRVLLWSGVIRLRDGGHVQWVR